MLSPLSRTRISIEPSTWTSLHTGTSERSFNEERDIRDVVAADGLQALLTRLPPIFLSSRARSRTLSREAQSGGSPHGFLWPREPVKRDQLVSPGAFYRSRQPPRLGREKKEGGKSDGHDGQKARVSYCARESEGEGKKKGGGGGGGGSSFDENCFRPRLQIQSTFSRVGRRSLLTRGLFV